MVPTDQNTLTWLCFPWGEANNGDFCRGRETSASGLPTFSSLLFPPLESERFVLATLAFQWELSAGEVIAYVSKLPENARVCSQEKLWVQRAPLKAEGKMNSVSNCEILHRLILTDSCLCIPLSAIGTHPHGARALHTCEGQATARERRKSSLVGESWHFT